MDTIDTKILEFLQTDCMKTAKEMAADLSLTYTPIYERIKKLENAGFVKQYVALLDADLLGKNLLVFLNLTVKDHSSEKREEFIQQLKDVDAITEFYHVSGAFDFVAKARFSNIKEYRDFLVNEVASIPNINDIDSQIVLEEIKYSTKVML